MPSKVGENDSKKLSVNDGKNKTEAVNPQSFHLKAVWNTFTDISGYEKERNKEDRAIIWLAFFAALRRQHNGASHSVQRNCALLRRFQSNGASPKPQAVPLTDDDDLRDQNERRSFLTQPYKLHRLDSGPSQVVSMTRTEGFQLLKEMLMIRETAAVAKALFADGLMRGRLHHHSGQEASCVGIESAIERSDSVISSYRTMGWCLIRGVPLRAILGELLGRITGVNGGKCGSMYMKGNKFYGGHGIVGAQVPIGAGLAFSHKYKEENNVCVTLYGDGCSNQGQVYEAFNMAKLWKLPCVFVCENNGCSVSTNMLKGSASTEFYTKGDYIPGIWVDGFDVLAVRESMRFAKKHALSQGPIIMELEFYLQDGHSISHPGTKFRTCEQIEVRKDQDPIKIHKNRMTSSNLALEDELTELEYGCKIEVDKVAKLCLEDPTTPVSHMYTDVMKDVPKDFSIRGCDVFTNVKPYK